MSQLDTVIYCPLFLWFLVGVLAFYVLVLCWVVPSLYKMLRLRDIYIKELGNTILIRIGHMYMLKKIFLFKLFVYRINEYYVYLCKKLK